MTATISQTIRLPRMATDILLSSLPPGLAGAGYLHSALKLS
jgi:hypothetical protein